MAQARGLLSVYQNRGTLVPRTCARTVVAPCGKACQGRAKNLHGPFLGQTKTRYLSQEDEAPARGACRAKKTRPRQEELAGPRRQDPGKRSLPGRPSRSTKAPARGARREGQPRHLRKTRRDAPRVPAWPGERQVPRRGKTTTTASHLPRQVTTSGLRSSSPTHASLWGSPRGTWRGTAQPGACGGMWR